MNPDPNQPQDQNAAPVEPAPIVPEVPSVEPTPIVPIEPTTPEAPATPVAEPAQYAAAPVTEAAANPEATPVTPPAEPVAEQPPVVSNPFAAAQDAPVVPVAAVNPATPVITPPISPVAPAPGKSKKKLVILLSSIIGGLIVLGGVAFAVYAMFFMVTKADYEAARDQLIVVRDIAEENSASNTSFTDVAEGRDTALAGTEKFKTEHAKLADLKALIRDKDLKLKYDAYAAKAKAYIEFYDVFTPSFFAFYNAQQEASEASSLYTTAALTTAINANDNALPSITEPTIKKYVEEQTVYYEGLMEHVKIYESTAETTDKRIAAVSAMSKAVGEFSEVTKTFTEEMKTKAESLSFDDALDDLGKAITAKLNDL